MRARAERQRETRRRIVAATAALHREVGPARTTIADIARRAGVERLTVYNHFGRLEDLLAACQADFLAGNPPPDLRPGDGAGDPLARFEATLVGLYSWFRANAELQRNVFRDRLLMPELEGLMRRHADPVFDLAADEWARLIARRSGSDRRSGARALVRIAVDFPTWDMLAAQGLSNRRIGELWRTAVGAAAARDGRLA